MWQLVGFYLGWIGEPGKGRALGVNSVKFTGEVLKNIKMATYEINMKRILKKEGTAVGLANGILLSLIHISEPTRQDRISYVANLIFFKTSPVNFTELTPKALPFPGSPIHPK